MVTRAHRSWCLLAFIAACGWSTGDSPDAWMENDGTEESGTSDPPSSSTSTTSDAGTTAPIGEGDGDSDETDEPPLPVCDCFVQEAWCGSGVAKVIAGEDCQVPLLPAHADDILYCPDGEWAVKEVCPEGCVQAAEGTPDYCSKPECDLWEVPVADYLKSGLHPDASDALAYLGVTAGRITQTIGSAQASAGTHAKDGTADGVDYAAATDLSVSGMSREEIRQFIDDLAAVGYPGWYRHPGEDGVPSDWIPHIHVVWVGAPMKLSLRNQIRSWVDGRNGLVSNTNYQFHEWSACRRDAVWQRFLQHNPATD